MDNEYFKILLVQLKVTLDYTNDKEYLIANNEYFLQMDKVIQNIKEKTPDIVVIPELCYHEKYDDFFNEYSKNKIIVFGSVYKDTQNFTVVYYNKKKHLIKKMFQSGVEPAIRYQTPISISDFLKKYLKDHTFKLKNKKFIVLNCAEYYKCAYFIARNQNLSKNLFGFLVPCANNKNDVFITESMALHNHNSNLYSFVVNSISSYGGKEHSSGGSYVFGKTSTFEKEFLKLSNIKHPSVICELDNFSSIIYGEFFHNQSNSYYRCDNYRHTPINLKIEKIGE